MDNNLFDVYKLFFENWRFQVSSGWQRTNYFAAFETALILATGKIILDGHSILGLVVCVFGLLLTCIWILNDMKVWAYISYWWKTLGAIEKSLWPGGRAPASPGTVPSGSKDGELLRDFVSNYDHNAVCIYKINKCDSISYHRLMRAVPCLFAAAWVLGLVTSVFLVVWHCEGVNIKLCL